MRPTGTSPAVTQPRRKIAHGHKVAPSEGLVGKRFYSLTRFASQSPETV
jgi:hypothetical protein